MTLHTVKSNSDRSSLSHTHAHTHRVLYTNASCVTSRLSHMIELAMVKFCSFLLS